MTRARALKQTIRARAAKTGERYTVARRHVLASLAAKPAQAAPAASGPPAPGPPSSKGSVSDTKIRQKTGHGLDHWFAVLDRFGGAAKGHAALARHLYDEHGVPGWHSQAITVAYEQARGVRVVNQRCDGEYEVSVSKVLAGSTADVVGALSDSRLRRRWAKDADAELIGALAASLEGPAAKDIVVRPDGLGRHRYKWGDTTVQLHLVPKAGKVSLVATNMKLRDAAMVEARRAQWRGTLEALARALR